MYIIKERGIDTVGKSVQTLLSQLQRVPKGAVQVPHPCIVRSVAYTRGKLSTFATEIRREEGATITSRTTINSTAKSTWTHRRS